MSEPEAELERLKALCPKAELRTEGGRVIALLPGLTFRAGGKWLTADALLWPWPRDNYPNRLFLSAPVPGKGNNWNVFSILGKPWHACSWNHVRSDLSWMEILANHLRAFR